MSPEFGHRRQDSSDNEDTPGRCARWREGATKRLPRGNPARPAASEMEEEEGDEIGKEGNMCNL